MKTRHIAASTAALSDMIGAGSFDPTEEGPECVDIEIPGGRSIIGSYYEGGADPDIVSNQVCLPTTQELHACIYGLITDGKPFTTSYASDEDGCTLEWTIRDGTPSALIEVTKAAVMDLQPGDDFVTGIGRVYEVIGVTTEGHLPEGAFAVMELATGSKRSTRYGAMEEDGQVVFRILRGETILSMHPQMSSPDSKIRKRAA